MKRAKKHPHAVCYNQREKTYSYEHLILLNETNASGGVVYFSNYVKWQGIAREMILASQPGFERLINGPVEMVTQRSEVEYYHHLYFGDIVRIEVGSKDVMPTSLVLRFRYIRKAGELLVALGEQKIAFVSKSSGRPCRMPELIRDLAKKVLHH